MRPYPEVAVPEPRDPEALVDHPRPRSAEDLLEELLEEEAAADPRSAKVYACEPARWRWKGTASWYWSREPESILFTTRAPLCTTCGKEVTWCGPPARRRGLYVYTVLCHCPPQPDPTRNAKRVRRIVSAFPLQMGGTRRWWRTVQRVEFRGRG